MTGEIPKWQQDLGLESPAARIQAVISSFPLIRVDWAVIKGACCYLHGSSFSTAPYISAFHWALAAHFFLLYALQQPPLPTYTNDFPIYTLAWSVISPGQHFQVPIANIYHKLVKVKVP